MKNLYEITGKITDINTLLINKNELDELRAELDAIRSQEPVAWMMASAMNDFKRGYIVEVSRNQEETDDLPLYAAPVVKDQT